MLLGKCPKYSDLRQYWGSFFGGMGMGKLIDFFPPPEADLLSPGFEAVLFLPPPDVQEEYLASLAMAYGRLELSGLVRPCFPDKLVWLARPPQRYLYATSARTEVRLSSLNHDVGRTRNLLNKITEVGMNLFEYMLFSKAFISAYGFPPDNQYSTWLLDSLLPDGRILCASHDGFKLRIWAWPAEGGEGERLRFHGCRSGAVVRI